MNRHEVHVFENGTASIRNLESGQVMHSEIGPDEEARHVYIAQADLEARLRMPTSEPLTLLDVGMGIASNVLAVLDEMRKIPIAGARVRPLRIISFENDLEGLRLALGDPRRFPTQDRHRAVLQQLVGEKRWTSPDGSIDWELRVGDFHQAPIDAAADLIFYDFYSPQSSPSLWTLAGFQKLFSACSPRRESALITYSAATAVRTALLLAGFYVSRGRATALKTETTLATAGLQAGSQHTLLGAEWLEKVARSSKPFPIDVDPTAALKLLRKSQQFS